MSVARKYLLASQIQFVILARMGVDIFANFLLVATSFVVAILIGATAIGTLLLVPSLNVIGDVPIHVAIPSCMFAIIFTGIVGALIFGRRGEIAYSEFFILALGASVAAFAGSLTLVHIPSNVIQISIAILCVASGAHALAVGRERNLEPIHTSGVTLLAIGALTGFGSAITGTGGPLILMPIMLALRMNIKQAVGLAQAIQIPIGLLATAGNLSMNRVDFDIALPVTAIVVIGAVIGALLAQKFSMTNMRLSVAGLLIISGAAYLFKAI
jgi:uncharacterized membrane protein YfcA